HEPRHINSSIDLTAYLAANADVDAAVQAGHMSALEHLLLFGVTEGRDLGNGITLAMFATDPAFEQALADGDAVAALLRVDTVAPFLPSFEPPPDWSPAPETPIVTDYTPPGGVKLVVPKGVIVPSGMALPSTYEQPPAPDTGGDVTPTFTVAME